MHAIPTKLVNYPAEAVAPGTALLRRAVQTDLVLFVESGRVAIGVIGEDSEAVEHQLGFLEGPGWLDATSAVLNLPSAVDAVAQTEVWVRRTPLSEFQACFHAFDESVQTMLLDVAKAHRQQTDLTISRLAKDAEARCAEWLLGQVRSNDKGVCSVQLQQRKRTIAAQLGIAPETLSRVLRHLRERSLISGTGRVVNLVDLHGLRSLAGN
ncbi:MAG: Crp/Fnr family transcriptional regulator [Rhodoferax sp.]|jgi:CRP-like cAMP-binding protein